MKPETATETVFSRQFQQIINAGTGPMHMARRRCFYSMKISCYPNATAVFQLMKILKSGDVALNPGK